MVDKCFSQDYNSYVNSFSVLRVASATLNCLLGGKEVAHVKESNL